MKDIADLQELINEKKIFLQDDDDIRDWYNILDVKIKNLKPRVSAFSIISNGYIILIFVLLISVNGILITLLNNLLRIGDVSPLAIILSVLFWIGVVIIYFKLEEPLNFIKHSIHGKLTELKNELIPYMTLQMQIIEVLLERNLMFKYRGKIKREKNKIEKYLHK